MANAWPPMIFVARLDDAVVADVGPAFVHLRGGVQHADFGDGGVHRDQVAVVDAVVGAERAGDRVGAALLHRRRRIVGGRPQRFGAHAVLEPALHGAARARAVVAFAGPLVVAARHGVEHVRADLAGVLARPPRVHQVVGDDGQPEAGAGAFLALVADLDLGLAEIVDAAHARHVDQRRHVHAVAEVDGIRPGIEDELMVPRANDSGPCSW